MDTSNWIKRHTQFDAGLDADQDERRAMLQGFASVEAGIEDERMSGSIDDSLVEAGNSWQERDVILESLSGAIAEEIQRRMDIMKDTYPFEWKEGSLSYRQSRTGIYELCLAVAGNPTGVDDTLPHASTVFEWISRDVLKLYMGPGAKGFRTGWPVHESESRGSTTRETLELLHAECSEFRWEPDSEHPNDPSPKYLKDCGLDVVVWKPWPDGRLAQLFALGQCACGKGDINPSKAKEADVNRLSHWLRPVCYSPPVRCFLAAHHIPNDIEIHDLSKEAGVIVMDRARLVMLAESSSDQIAPPAGFNYHELASFYATQKVG